MNINQYISGLQHIGIPTLDLTKSICFYKDLGFHVLYLNQDKRAVFLEYKGLVLEFWETDSTGLSSGAIDHIALDVVDIEAVFCEISALQYEIITEGIQKLPFWDNGVKFFAIVGPNKERIEFCQKL